MFLPLLGGIGLAASAIGGLFKTGLGVAQMIKSGRMKPQRPTYEPSERIAQNLALRQQQLGGRMAGAAEAEANLRQSTSSQLANVRQAAGSGAQLLAMGGLAQAQENRGLLGLQAQEAQDYQRRLQGVERANLAQAQEERAAWDYNERQKYEEEARAKARVMQAGLQNTYSGIGGISGMAGQAFLMESLQPGFLGSIFGQGQQPDTGALMQGVEGGAGLSQGLGVGANLGMGLYGIGQGIQGMNQGINPYGPMMQGFYNTAQGLGAGSMIQ